MNRRTFMKRVLAGLAVGAVPYDLRPDDFAVLEEKGIEITFHPPHEDTPIEWLDKTHFVSHVRGGDIELTIINHTMEEQHFSGTLWI